MEYTRDIVLNVNYGQAGINKEGLISKFIGKIMRHKIITSIVFITVMMISLDVVLVSSFIRILSNMQFMDLVQFIFKDKIYFTLMLNLAKTRYYILL